MRPIQLLLLFLLFHCAFSSFAMEPKLNNQTIQINEKWKAEAKLKELWDACVHSEYSKIPPVNELDFCDLCHLNDPDYTKLAFTHCGYTMLPGRQKDIHGSGAVIKVSFERNPAFKHSYTGIFQNGGPFALMRMSYAVPPKDGKAVVGMALMFLRDEESASSVFAMPSLDPLPANQILENDFLTSVKMPENTWKNYLLEQAFTKGCDRLNRGPLNARSLTVSALAETTANGMKVQEPKAPYGLVFRASDNFRALLAKTSAKADIREILNGKAKPGFKLFHVLTRETKDAPEQYIGDIVAQSSFSIGSAGDEEIFFQHPVPHVMDEEPMVCPILHQMREAWGAMGF